MPIYAYRCAACGHAKDVLQKMSDQLLRVCPVCGEDEFEKQVTAAGFQLKGSGWYATDFKGSGAAPAAKIEAGEAANKGDSGPADAKADGKSDGKSDAKADGKSDAALPAAGTAPAPTPAPAPAAGNSV